MIYLKLDMTHADYERALTELEAAFAAVLPNNRFSINANAQQTLCWVKAERPIDSAAVVDSADYESRSKVLTEVTTPGWTG